MPKKVLTQPSAKAKDIGANGAPERGALDADIIIANAPDPVFVSDLEGKILQANDAVSQLLGFRPDELIEQSLSRFISPEETREFTAALREVVEKGVTRNARLNPRSASRRGDPDDAQRLGPARPGRAGHRRHRHPPRHARAGQGPGLRREPDQERPGPGVRLRPRGQDPPGQRRRRPSCSASAPTS